MTVHVHPETLSVRCRTYSLASHKSQTYVLAADHTPISLVRLKLPYMGCTRAPGDSPYDSDPTYIALLGHWVLVWVLVWVSGHLHPPGHTRGRIKQTTKQTTIYGRYGWLRGKKRPKRLDECCANSVQNCVDLCCISTLQLI